MMHIKKIGRRLVKKTLYCLAILTCLALFISILTVSHSNKQKSFITSFPEKTKENPEKQQYFLATAQNYINPGEKLINFAVGGGSSLVLFIKKDGEAKIIARKVWSSKTQTIEWGNQMDHSTVMAPPIQKGYLQIEYLQNLPESVKDFFPKILSFSSETDENGCFSEVICDESYIEGIEVSTFIKKYQPSPQIVAALYTEIFRCLREVIHTHRKKQFNDLMLEVSYLKKVEDRLRTANRAIPKVMDFLLQGETITINNQNYINIPTILNYFRHHPHRDNLEPPYLCLVSGDTNTQNIMISETEPLFRAIQTGVTDFTYKEIGIKFIDPRAVGFNSKGSTTVDDPLYDSKPFHNSFGNYDMIYDKHFDLINSSISGHSYIEIIEMNNPYALSYNGLESHFKDIMKNGWGVNQKFIQEDPHWLTRFIFLLGTHFAAMIPFQIEKIDVPTPIDDVEAQKRAVAIYCEGVKWLNLALKILDGATSEFLGISVHQELFNRVDNCEEVRS